MHTNRIQYGTAQNEFHQFMVLLYSVDIQKYQHKMHPFFFSIVFGCKIGYSLLLLLSSQTKNQVDAN